MAKQNRFSAVLVALILSVTACAKKSDTSSASASEDISASGSAAEAVGGALSGSLASGTQAMMQFNLPQSPYDQIKSFMNPLPSAFAQSLCPTYLNTDSSCSATGGTMWLSYSDCSFKGRAAWNGTQALSMSAGSAACGTFPNPGANQILYRQYVSGAGSNTPSQLTLTSGGYSGTVDDSVSNLGNFDNQSISTINPNGGYGVAVHFAANGSRSSIAIGRRHAVSGAFDHSISGSLSIVEGVSASSRVVSGSVLVYHNLLKVVGTSQFQNVLHDNTCCLPISGEITTTFSAGANVSPTAKGSLMVGKSETLTFTGCRTANLTDTAGAVHSVTLNRCF